MPPEPTAAAGGPENHPDWVPPEALQQLAQTGSARVVAELLDDFRRDVTARLLQLRRAIDHNDGPAIRIQVHSIKGSAAQMGADRLAAACLQLELDMVRGVRNVTAADVESIQALFDEVSAAIARHPLSSPP